MTYDLVIQGATVVRANGSIENADVGVAEQKFVAIEPTLAAAAGTPIVDAHGLTMLPGVVDAHVHFNDPGRDHWEGIATGSAALAAGGGTCFIDMPLNSSPPTLTGAAFDKKLARARARSRTDFALYGGLTPDSIEHMEELAERGVVGFKAFMCPSGIDDFHWADDDTLLRGMERASGLGLPVLVHAENAGMTGLYANRAREKGMTDPRSFIESRPIAAELEAIGRALLFAEETGCKLHIVHISNRRGIRMVRRAVAAGRVDASCETCPHYLILTDADMITLGPSAKCAPPLRSEDERVGLLSALRHGEIDIVGSDHSPAPPEIKERDNFFEAWGGIAGVQTSLQVLLTLGVQLDRIASVLAHSPARRFGLNGKAGIAVGADADFALVDTQEATLLTRDVLRDRHRMNPLRGRTLRGIVRQTYLRGSPVTEATRGRLVYPENRPDVRE